MDLFQWSNRLRPARVVLAALLLCASGTGCDSGQEEVRGTVRCNGLPLPSGTIQFLGPDGVPHAGTIQPDGTYSVEVPVGEAKAIVSCLDEARLNLALGRPAGHESRATPPPLPAEGFSRIPQRYADWDVSGLTVLVEPGGTVHDFDLVAP
jgi:hypothetical protein